MSNNRPEIRGRESVGTSLCVCCGKVIFFGLGAILFVTGLTLGILWPFMFNTLLRKQLSLTPTSRTLDMWKETPLPMYMEVYLFNWTNHATSLRGPDKPAFVEMGPYVFQEHRSKLNLVWNDNGTVTYLNRKRWIFRDNLSNGSLSDKVTNLNVIVMTIGSMCKTLPKISRELVSLAVDLEERLVVTNSVGDLLFNGCDDKILKIVDILKKYIKSPIPYDKFGWFYKKNMSATADGVFNMYTGVDDIEELGLLNTWNYKKQTGSFSGDCGKVQGTMGELFPPGSVGDSEIKIFANDICSTINLKAGDTVTVNNLTAVKFVAGKDVFDNSTTCYCRNGKCPASGVRDVSSCKHAPAFISFPHFYLADPSYRNAVEGMNPDPEKHSFYITLSKITSTPVDVKGRLQINILMESIPDMKYFRNISRTYMPMIWFNEHATITESMASELMLLSTLSQWGPVALFLIAGLGGVLILIGLIFKTKGFCDPSREERLLDR